MTITTHPLRHLGAITLFLTLLLWSGCGDTFRPVVIPIPPTPPDPRNAHTAFAITNNGPFNPGSLMLIDVSGDSTIGIGNVGIAPSHVALVPPGAGHIAVANQGNNTVTVISTSGFGGGLAAPSTVTLPPQFNPVFLASAENNILYVGNVGNTATATPPPSVAVISTLSNTVTNVINLTAIAANSPMSLVETPDAHKVYVATQLSTATGAVTSINTVDKTANTPITDPSISQPVSIVARSDSARVYVLSQGNGDVATIDTFTDTLISPATPPSVGAGADFMLYDSRLNRLYVTNSALGTLTIFDSTVDPPSPLATLSLPGGANPSCAIGCASVAALPDGTRAYVTTLRQNGSNVSALVTAVNTSNNTIIGSTSLPTTPAVTSCAGTRFRLSTAAAADGTHIYAANCDAGNLGVVHTADNTLINLPTPVSAANAVTMNITSAVQNGSETTYAYTLTSGAGLQVGMSVVITTPINGQNVQQSFIISSLGPSTFTVLNPAGPTAGTNATATAIPLQNPVFVLAGP